MDVRYHLENGQSVLWALNKSIEGCSDDFSRDIARLLIAANQGRRLKFEEILSTSPYRRAALELFELGMGGEPILRTLKELETEVREASARELEHYIRQLPVRAMLPVLLLQFPAFLLLVLGPMVVETLKGLNS
jgi:hypothetical protein